MKKPFLQVAKAAKATKQSVNQPPASSAERKLRVVYWAGAVVLVAVKIYMVIHGG